MKPVKAVIVVVGLAGSMPLLYYGGLVGAYGLSVAFGRDTEFAPGYSEHKFGQVRQGMPRAEVEALIGTGVWTSGDARIVSYTRSPTGTHYDQRQVKYDDDRVSEVVSEIYFD